MRVRKFKAKTMPEAMERIKQELGSDAVILQQKVLKTAGFLGMFKQHFVEVIAALDEAPLTSSHHLEESQQVNRANPPHQSNEQILNEIKHLQQLINTKSFESEEQFPPVYEYAYHYLQNQGIDRAYAKEWIVTLTEEAPNHFTPSREEIRQRLLQKIEQVLQQMPIKDTRALKQVMQFVGPTGVGKTTTIAKIASQAILNGHKKIAFITLDTYRIGAIEQLKTYAKILNSPIEVAYSLEDYKEALRKLADYDHIFVDTPGRNFMEVGYVQQLKKMLTIEQMDVQTILVLALTTKEKDLEALYKQFSTVTIENMILTKLDETSTYGSIVNLYLKAKIPMLYFTNGQSVPEDLMKPEIKEICRMILGRYGDD
jgi:flagellar biosynthesis protein FlhF